MERQSLVLDPRHYSGQAAELYVASRFVALGYNVLWPLMTQSRYDLVVEKDGVFQRLQVKKATSSKAGPHTYLQARLSNRKKDSVALYLDGEFELFVFTDLKRIWVAPYKELAGYTSVCLGSTNPSYKPFTKYDASTWLMQNLEE